MITATNINQLQAAELLYIVRDHFYRESQHWTDRASGTLHAGKRELYQDRAGLLAIIGGVFSNAARDILREENQQ